MRFVMILEEWWQWQPTPVLLPGKSYGRRSLVICNPWGLKELDTTERIHFHFSLSCIGEGNGNPLQCSCLETPMDRGAWWATVYGVAQSWTQLNRLSSSSSSNTETPPGGMLPRTCRPQSNYTWGLMMLTPTSSLSEEWPGANHAVTIKLVTIFPSWGHMVWRAWAHCVPLSMAKQ